MAMGDGLHHPPGRRRWLARVGAWFGTRGRSAADLADELNLLVDGAHGYAIYMLDPGGHVRIWNQGAERMKGWTEAEVLGRHCSIFYPADALAAGKPAADLARAQADGRYEEDAWRLRRDGSEFLAHVSITALRSRDGTLRGFGKVLRDATDQRAFEQALEASASHLRSILSTVPDGMGVIDEEGRILSFNPAAERMFGLTEADMVGEDVGRLMAPPDRDRHEDYLRRYRETGVARIIGRGRMVTGLRADGSRFPMQLTIGEAADGQRRLFTGFIEDLTERVEAQAQIEELRTRLVRVARVGAMGTLASTLAHELNQPITAVANYVEAVRALIEPGRTADGAMLREALAEAASEALRAGEIVRRLRTFVARGEVERTVEPLAALVAEAAALGLAGARAKGIEVVIAALPGPALVLVDRVQIQQVLINLLHNAVEAMVDVAQPALRVETAADERPGHVRVTVADNGPGVVPAVAERLFDAFVTTRADGMGLGLSICRTIVEANGGRIWHEPNPGGGSRFHFTLPAADGEEPDEAADDPHRR
jgi:two-component system sensor kinase FixL